MELVREGPIIPERPAPDDPPFHRTPLAATFAARRSAYFQWLLQQPTPPDKRGVWTIVGKLAAGEDSFDAAPFEDALAFVNARQDPSDFYLTALIRLFFLNQGGAKLSDSAKSAIREAILNYKYRLDEPNTTWLEMWTENHQILTASAEYLAGQLFPDTVFSNNGETGRQRQARAKQRLLDWIRWRARTGFAEWDSSWYYPDDLAALLNLVDFAEEPEVAQQATMLTDLILFDTVVDSFFGFYATSHGRITTPGVKSAAGDTMLSVQAIAWGLGRFEHPHNMGAISLATSVRYSVPAVLEAIAVDVPEEYENRERHSIPLEKEAAAQYGLSFDNIDDLWVWWGMGAFSRREIIGTTARAAEQWELWHYDAFRPIRRFAGVLRRLKLLGRLSEWLRPDANGLLLSEVNKTTWRTPDYQLSTAQDFRKGEKGYQQHVWQATLGPYATVFTSNPDSLRTDDKERPGYWFGNGRLPRAAQFKNLVIALYKTRKRRSPLEKRHFDFTHAYFPRWAFDEVREIPAEQGGWIFARKDDGYVALYSRNPYSWITAGADADQDVVAEGRKNVWICQLGRVATDGDFDHFVDRISSARLKVRRLSVEFDSPGLGLAKFDWRGPLTIDGQEISLRDYPRWRNPYADSAFGGLQFHVEQQGKSLELDFDKGTRVVS